jgi:hypothetical protein
MVRLTRLEIGRWRNVQPGLVLDLADGYNIVVGPNGTGKSHLLDLLTLLLRGDLRPFEAEAFELGYTVADDDGFELTVRIQSTPRDSAGVWAEPPDSAVSGRMSLGSVAHRFESVGDRLEWFDLASGAPLRSAPFRLFQGGLNAQIGGAGAPWLAIKASQPWPPAVAWGWFANQVVRMDEGLALFEALVARTGEERLRTLGQDDGVMGLTRSPRGAWSGDLVTGFAFLSPEAIQPRLDAVAQALREAAGFDTVQLSLRQRSDVRYHGLDLHFRPHPNGNLFREAEALSFGQKRLFTWLVLSAVCPHVPLFADELTNGLHHALVRTCIEAIGDRQAFLATQEPLLLDHLEFDSAEAVRKTFVVCRTNEAGQWVWEKPTAEMAEAVYGSYCVDVKHVSEIVRTLGLW